MTIDHKKEIARLNEETKIYLAPSKIHGIGVYALRDIAENEKVYADQLPLVYTLPQKKFKKLRKEVAKMILEQWPGVALDQRFAWPTARHQAYMNHSDDPNFNPHNDTALREIKAGEEITEDYRLLAGHGDVYEFLK